MTKGVYIFGNGLGMALSEESYSLTEVMAKVWQGSNLDIGQQQLISACLPEGIEHPESEEQLAILQETLSACEVLLNVEQFNTAHWLSDEGKKFPDAVHRFFFSVAREMYFAKSSINMLNIPLPCKLPMEFVKPFVDRVKSTSSHVATLNYDGLLSRALSEHGIFNAPNSVLKDGFDESKFDRKNLFRPKQVGGWYLHLHGSPLFADRERSKPYKLSEKSLRDQAKNLTNIGRHVVLTYFSHKLGRIESSVILKTYWEFLEMAIEESERIVIFGYSGNDLHLNRLISQVRGDKSVCVVEWLGAGNKATRSKFWGDQLGSAVDLRLLEDILTFNDW